MGKLIYLILVQLIQRDETIDYNNTRFGAIIKAMENNHLII
jgi:hypothetical protein